MTSLRSPCKSARNIFLTALNTAVGTAFFDCRFFYYGVPFVPQVGLSVSSPHFFFCQTECHNPNNSDGGKYRRLAKKKFRAFHFYPSREKENWVIKKTILSITQSSFQSNINYPTSKICLTDGFVFYLTTSFSK